MKRLIPISSTGRRWDPVVLISLCLLIIMGFIWLPEGRFPTRYLPFFHIQAAAFLKGEVALQLPLGWTHDIIETQSGKYLALPPLGAFAALPFVLIGGLGSPETLMSATLGLGFLVSLWAFLEHFGSQRQVRERRLVFLATALGTPAFYAAVNGTAWFTACLLANSLLMGGLILLDQSRESGRLPSAMAGLALTCLASFSRLNLAPLVPLFGLLLWLDGRPKRQSHLVPLFLPTALLLAAVGLWNLVRFGTPLALNYATHGYGAHFEPSINAHGMTSLHHVPAHLEHGFIGAPTLTGSFPFFEVDSDGNGFFVLSPLFLLLFRRPLRITPAVQSSILALAIVIPPIVTLFSTGWSQFGYRYILDLLPFLLILLLKSSARLTGPVAIGATLISLYFSFFGTLMHLEILDF